MSWSDKIRSHFADRSELGIDELCREFGLEAGTDQSLLKECLSVFEEEYELKIGWLRSSDPIDLFTEPPPAGDPFRWFFYRAAIENRISELNFHLKEARKKRGLPADKSPRPQTLLDFVKVWLGRDESPV